MSGSTTAEGRCRSTLVLLSGGIDSACCAHWFAANGYSVTGFFVDYGQVARVYEEAAADAIAQELGLELEKVAVGGLKPPPGNIRGRNGALLMLALMRFQHDCGVIALGIHEGTGYEDCSPVFVADMQRIFDLYADGQIRVGAPFLHWSKRDVFQYARLASLPLHLTYSCETGSAAPCGQCLSCRDMEALHA